MNSTEVSGEAHGTPAAGDGAGLEADRRLQALAEISRLVTLGLDERAILQHVTEALARLLDSPYARLWMLDEGNGDLVLAVTAGTLTTASEISVRWSAELGSLNHAVLESGQMFQTPDVTADPRWRNRAATSRHGLRTYLGVPLLVGEQRFGILTLLFHQAREIGRAHV